MQKRFSAMYAEFLGLACGPCYNLGALGINQI